MKTFLEGKKTYLVAVAMLAYQVLGYFVYGTMPDVKGVLEALAIITMRAGIAKVAA